MIKTRRTIIIAITIAIIGMIVSQLFITETNVTSIIHYHDSNHMTESHSQILPGYPVQGEFRASADNLGMVKLRIRTFNRLNTSHVRFRLREKGAETWIADNSYTVDRFVDGLLYPFGFPPVSDSKDKIYEFMIDTQDGTPDNSIGIRKGFHDIATQYGFQRTNLQADPVLLRWFIIAKMKSILSDPYSVAYLSLFMVPGLVLIAPKFGLLLVAYTVFVYAYLPVSVHSNILLGIALSVIFISVYARISSSWVFRIALILLLQIPLLIAMGNTLQANRSASQILILMAIGACMVVKETAKQ